MRLLIHALTLVGAALLITVPANPQASGNSDLNSKIAALDLETAVIDDILRLFGDPEEYVWGDQKFTKENLPAVYLAIYPGGFQALIQNRDVVELRFSEPGYLFRGAVQVGSTLDDVLKTVAAPKAVFESEPNGFVPGVLYKNIDGVRGRHYYCSREDGIRLFFGDDKVSALYLSRKSSIPDLPIPTPPPLPRFSDVRSIGGRVVDGGRDVSQLDLSQAGDILPTLTFNQETPWPGPSRMPADVRPGEILETAMNPGLRVREIHESGLTGKGVSVAIIDQPMYLDHPEFAGKVAKYRDFESGVESSMHGPAVSSLLVGTKTGTAPEATLYFAAVPSWLRDAAYYARALWWILEENESLDPDRKIRVVSVSAAPSGLGSPYDTNTEQWDEAVRAAEDRGVLVLDCTQHGGRTAACWFDFKNPDRENPAKCLPGYPGLVLNILSNRILAPASPRTTAEEYERGGFGYQYTGRGGLSWTPPFIAGVLALGWEQRPDLTGEQMLSLLFESAFVREDQLRVVNPQEFVRRVAAYGQPAEAQRRVP